MKSKILFFSVLAVLMMKITGCSDVLKNDEIIPDVGVNVLLNVMDADRRDLDQPGCPIYVKSYLARNVGYLGNGIIVMQAGSEYLAYDATCTKCLDQEGIIGIEKGMPVGKCKKCLTEFDFYSYGMPISSGNNESDPEKIYPLKRYSAVRRGNEVKISN